MDGIDLHHCSLITEVLEQARLVQSGESRKRSNVGSLKLFYRYDMASEQEEEDIYSLSEFDDNFDFKGSSVMTRKPPPRIHDILKKEAGVSPIVIEALAPATLLSPNQHPNPILSPLAIIDQNKALSDAVSLRQEPLHLSSLQKMTLMDSHALIPPEEGDNSTFGWPRPVVVNMTTFITEELNMNFSGGTDVGIILEGHVHLTLNLKTASWLELHDIGKVNKNLELTVNLLDRASQICATQVNNPYIAPIMSTKESRAGSDIIRETPSDSGATLNYVCRIPEDKLSSTAPLTLPLLTYQVKSSVRPLPVRIQQSTYKLNPAEGQVFIFVQVTSNPGLFLPLSSMSLTLNVVVPGVDFGQGVISATPALGVTWRAPVLQWTLAQQTELKPGETMVFTCILPIKTNKTHAEQASLGAVFKAQSRASLTRIHVQIGRMGEIDRSLYEIHQETRKRFRVAAKIDV